MMGFLAAGAGAGVVAVVDVVMPEKSAKSSLLPLADDAEALLMNPKAEFDALSMTQVWVGSQKDQLAGVIGEEEAKSIPNCGAPGAGAGAGAEL